MNNTALNPHLRQTNVIDSAFCPQDLRIGNILNYDTEQEGIVLTVIDWQDLKWLSEKPESFNKKHRPMPLTEDLISKFKRQYKDHSKNEFQKQEAKKGQENQYWSSWFNDDEFRIKIEPCYDYDFIGNTHIKTSQIKFWFCWYMSQGSNVMPLMSIRENKLLNVHQLQNLFYWLTGHELVLS